MSQSPGTDSDEDADLPRSFGRYLLLAALGRGGMGAVYLAKQPHLQGIERYCVIKRLRVRKDRSAQDIARFLDEARVVVQLNHKNICRVFDVGQVGDELFLAMDLIQGRDLRTITQRLRERGERLPLPLALLVGKELLVALDYAHRLRHPATGEPLRLVHRDVSPHNIMISYEGELLLIDFGLAASTMKEHQTGRHEVFGKLAYMAPEQLKAAGVDARTDLYAAGIVVYELLTGRDFFSGATPDELLACVVADSLPEPDWSLLPAGLEGPIRRAVAEDVTRRFASCADLRQALERYERDHEITGTEEDLRAFMAGLFPGGPAALREVMFEHSSTGLARPAGILDSRSPGSDEPLYDGATTDPVLVADETALVTEPDGATQRIPRRGLVETQRVRRPTGRGPILAAGAAALVALVLALVVGPLSGSEPSTPLAVTVPPVTPGELASPPVDEEPPGAREVPAAADAGAPVEPWAFDARPAAESPTAPSEPPLVPDPARARRATRPAPKARADEEPRPALRTTADKLRFLGACKKPCAKDVSARARALSAMSQQDARRLFDDVDRCVPACGG